MYEEEGHRIRKNSASCKSDKRLISKIYNELKKQGVKSVWRVGDVKNMNRERGLKRKKKKQWLRTISKIVHQPSLTVVGIS